MIKNLAQLGAVAAALSMGAACFGNDPGGSDGGSGGSSADDTGGISVGPGTDPGPMEGVRVFEMSGRQLFPPVLTAGSGEVQITVDEDTGEAQVRAVVRDVDPAQMWVSVRRGYFGGPENFDVVDLKRAGGAWVTPDDTVLDGYALDAWNQGRLFVLVTNAEHPDGVLRGQVGKPGVQVVTVDLLPDNVTADPPVASSASARAFATINPDEEVASFAVRVRGTEATSVQFRGGLMGVNDPNPTQQVHLTYRDPNADDVWAAVQDYMSPELVGFIERGQTYFVVYSEAYGIETVHGELRGALPSPFAADTGAPDSGQP